MHSFLWSVWISVTEIASESNIFYDTNQKILQKKGFIFPRILHLQVMHDYVHWYCSLDCCVKLRNLISEKLYENCFISQWNDFCWNSFGKCASWRRAKNRYVQTIQLFEAISERKKERKKTNLHHIFFQLKRYVF